MKTVFNKVTPVTTPLELRGVDYGYPQTPVFNDLTVALQPRRFSALVGSNGSGKSTLLGLLAGVLRPERGVVEVGTRNIAFAVQRSKVTDDFPITAAEAVMMGRWRHLGLLKRPTRADRAVVDHWLHELGLDDLKRRTLGELSGGQRQRVLLAQAFAQQAPLLLLDEPTTGLDAASAALVTATLHHLADGGTTVIAATHDAQMIETADYCLNLDETAPRGPAGPQLVNDVERKVDHA
ncbi:zinc ABC transporter ATP-binding protein AztA [Mycobacterium sp. SMC-4]|uniref:zinc ABC transporter ATP-binding protein AztA n=1 Tax=Mycobacterium sp. SMC-4 TaxID=2857059 RepID=UPI0021B2B846|nr:zinc ABC transporter ATP-binding protein AztA [Mycobacterium sp. SMC-4]UXA17589.1 metal ABC transporter ATP-binding protein [Mycobacterium sp. SMC-4]